MAKREREKHHPLYVPLTALELEAEREAEAIQYLPKSMSPRTGGRVYTKNYPQYLKPRKSRRAKSPTTKASKASKENDEPLSRKWWLQPPKRAK